MPSCVLEHPLWILDAKIASLRHYDICLTMPMKKNQKDVNRQNTIIPCKIIAI